MSTSDQIASALPVPKPPQTPSSLRVVLLGLALAAFALVLIGFAGFGLYRFSVWAAGIFTQLNPNVAASIIAGIVTVTISVATLIIGRRLEATAVIRKEHREKKAPVYEQFLAFMFKIMFADKLGVAVTEVETLAFLSEFTQKMMVWGSDEVLSHWASFKNASQDGKKPEEMLFLYEQMVYAIRRDLGHRNKNLTRGRILSLFVTDIHKYV